MQTITANGPAMTWYLDPQRWNVFLAASGPCPVALSKNRIIAKTRWNQIVDLVRRPTRTGTSSVSLCPRVSSFASLSRSSQNMGSAMLPLVPRPHYLGLSADASTTPIVGPSAQARARTCANCSPSWYSSTWSESQSSHSCSWRV